MCRSQLIFFVNENSLFYQEKDTAQTDGNVTENVTLSTSQLLQSPVH